jgi:PPM family protein phosphatase
MMQREAKAAQLGVTGAMLSHSGCVRERNEDFVAWTMSDDASRQFRMMAVVADGMGGHAAGNVASEIAGRTVLRRYNEVEGTPSQVLRVCMNEANDAIIQYARANPVCAGMGTTCTVLALKEDSAFIAHIGDSRAYLLRHGTLHQISEDHSLIAHLIKRGELSVEEAATSPHRGSILRALGIDSAIEPYVFREGMKLSSGDVFVLCSDGLTDVVDDKAIRETVASNDPDNACRMLVDQALAAGGPDNISVGIFLLGGQPKPPAGARTTRPLPRAGGGQ